VRECVYVFVWGVCVCGGVWYMCSSKTLARPDTAFLSGDAASIDEREGG